MIQILDLLKVHNEIPNLDHFDYIDIFDFSDTTNFTDNIEIISNIDNPLLTYVLSTFHIHDFAELGRFIYLCLFFE